MPILPEEIATATFTRVHRQGYHTGEVDAFLRTVAADYAAALEKMLLSPSEPVELDIGEEVNSILRSARASASALLQRAQEEADALQKAATEKAQEIETQASQARVLAFEQSAREAQQVKAEADRYSQELRHRAETESREMVETAEARARELFNYNEQLNQHLHEIERLVGALRSELDGPARAWPGETALEEPAPGPEAAERDTAGSQEDEQVEDEEMLLQNERV